MSEENKIIEGSVVVLNSDNGEQHAIKMTVVRIIKQHTITTQIVKDFPED